MTDLVEVLARVIVVEAREFLGTVENAPEVVKAQLAALDAAGYRVVPVEPTDAMRRVARDYFGLNPFEPNNQPYDHIWLSAFAAMLAATPKVTPRDEPTAPPPDYTGVTG